MGERQKDQPRIFSTARATGKSGEKATGFKDTKKEDALPEKPVL
jgi:hypothetical protein